MPNNIARTEHDPYVPQFPIQSSIVPNVPWVQAEVAYQNYFRLSGGHAGATVQTLDQIAKRGGWGLPEFACLYQGHLPKGDIVHMFGCIAQTFYNVGQDAKPEPEDEDAETDSADQTG